MSSFRHARLAIPDPRRMSPEWLSKVDVSRPTRISSFGKMKDGSMKDGCKPPLLKKCAIGENLSSNFHLYQPKTAGIANSTDITDAVSRAGYDITKNKISIVTYRNNLNKILASPYNQDAWTIGASRKQGDTHVTLEILDYHSEPEFDRSVYDTQDKIEGILKLKHNDPKKQGLMSYWGRRLEELCTESPSEEEKERENVPLEVCYCVRSRINKHRILVGAEMDAIEPVPSPSSTSPSPSPSTPSSSSNKTGDSGPSMRLVEIKSSRELTSHSQKGSFEKFKLMKFWIQSFLAGIPTILVGWRDDKGLITGFDRLDVMGIPRRVRKAHGDQAWQPNVCLNFADSVFTFLQQNVEEGRIYQLRRRKGEFFLELGDVTNTRR